MLHIRIIASGLAYHEAAAWAAATYAAQMSHSVGIAVMVPEHETVSEVLSGMSRRFGFQVQPFPVRVVSPRKYTSQLKCQGFLHALGRRTGNDIVLFADADTYCCCPVVFGPELEAQIQAGQIGMVPDVVDRHSHRPRVPWYLPPNSRTVYVNSGVILAGPTAVDMFQKFADLCVQPEFLRGPFNDQKVINYALGKYFKGRLILLDKRWNGMRRHRAENVIIGHCAGGAGRFGGQRGGRKARHQRICARIIDAMLAADNNSASPAGV